MLVALAVVAALLLPGTTTPRPDPLRERAEQAASIGGELAGVARSQLEALPPDGRAEVEEVLSVLERDVDSVMALLESPLADSGALTEAVFILEKTLGGLLVDEKPAATTDLEAEDDGEQ